MPETTSAPERVTVPAPETSRRPRPITLRVLGVWLAVLAVLAGAGTTAVAGESSHNDARQVSLAGQWDLVVTIHTPNGVSTVTPRFTFHENHQLSAPGPLGPDGQPVYVETGYWTEERDGTFALYINHPGAPGGAIPGNVQAVHLGKITGKRLRTSAWAFVTPDGGGAPIGPILVETTGVRVSAGASS